MEDYTLANNVMKLNKALGLDGIAVDFYQMFWKNKIFLVKGLNTGNEKGSLSHAKGTSIMTLLFKKGDHLFLDNYRPISLLGIDLKLLSFVLAQRFKKILPILKQIQFIIDYADAY